ncbi:MAG: PucR family transcriptional regulator [Bacillota bacterium]
MDPLTVGKILAFPALRSGSLLAGKGGLNRHVYDVEVIDDHDVSVPLEQGLLVLASKPVPCRQTRSIVRAQREFIETMIQAEIAGLVVRVSQSTAPFAPEIIALCDKNDLPLIVVPFDVTYGKIVQTVNEALLLQDLGGHPLSRLQTLFLQDLLAARIDVNDLHSRALLFGWNTLRNAVAIVIKLERDRAESYPARIDKVSNILARVAQGCSPSLPYCTLGSLGMLLCLPSEREQVTDVLKRAMSVASQVSQETKKVVGDSCFSVGLSQCLGDQPSYLYRACQEAIEAALLGAACRGPGKAYVYDDVRSLKVLKGIAEMTEFRQVFHKTIGRLVEEDQQRGTQLIRTLELYFKNSGRAAQTAAALYVHRNTLRYRLNQVKDLTGLDVDDPEDRFVLELGLKVRPFLNGEDRLSPMASTTKT